MELNKITSVFKIHDTVIKVSSEAKELVPNIPIVKSEIKLLSELILCIISSQERYEVALAIMKQLQEKKVLIIPSDKKDFHSIKIQIKSILQNPVYFNFEGKIYTRRLRFFEKKTEYIIKTIENIYFNNLTISKILRRNKCVFETRKEIISFSFGLGPKQASMFLRNIGYYSDYAVIDKHVIDYMRIMGMMKSSGFSNLNTYQIIETKLKTYAAKFSIKLLHLDLAIWTTMRNLKYFQS